MVEDLGLAKKLGRNHLPPHQEMSERIAGFNADPVIFMGQGSGMCGLQARCRHMPRVVKEST